VGRDLPVADGVNGDRAPTGPKAGIGDAEMVTPKQPLALSVRQSDTANVMALAVGTSSCVSASAMSRVNPSTPPV
jgi:hypothetical protein